ncbi:MAG TPA: PEGA domain-containing protein [Terriglobales bacterium]|nr:PEGA domain-containing protein [Terriglobales bacterium]
MPSTITIAQAPSTDTKPNQDAKSAQTTEAAAPKPAMQGFGLEDGTPVKIRTARTISSADAHTGDTLDFEVLEDVLVKDTLVIPKGGIAWGTVTDAQPKRRMGRGGKLDVNIDAVRLVDGEKVPLRAVKDVKGGGHTGAMTGAMVGTAIVFFPAAPLFLFMHGKDITIPKGTEITAYINGNTRLEEAKFKAATPGTVATAPVTTSTALLDISSTPAGADIEIDGKFVGSTPSSISLSPGDHDIVVKKAGFSAWQKKMSVSAGHITLAAELVAESK